MKSGDYVKIVEPKWAKTCGQGLPPKGISASVDGSEFLFKYGDIYKVSSNTTYPGNPEAKPYPLIHSEYANQIESSLEIQQQKKR